MILPHLTKKPLYFSYTWDCLALQIFDLQTNETLTGDLIAQYAHVNHGDGTIKNYKIPSTGDFMWERFIEPEHATKENKWESKEAAPDYPHILFQDGNFYEERENLQLHLLIKNQNLEETLTLIGPVIDDLSARLKLKQPESQVLGLLDVLNPLQKGGLWDVWRSAARYGKCIQLRKQSKYELDKRFRDQLH